MCLESNYTMVIFKIKIQVIWVVIEGFLNAVQTSKQADFKLKRKHEASSFL